MSNTIALLSDVHANLPALDAVLAALEPEPIDAIWHLGDAVAIGPFPAECVQRLLALPNFRGVRGNHDGYAIEGVPVPQPRYMSDGEVVHQGWTRAQLSAEMRHQLAQWPTTFTTTVEGVVVHATHYALQPDGADFAPIRRNPTCADVADLFAETAISAELILYGHDHTQRDCHTTRRFHNPGALGTQPSAEAPYSMLTFDRGTVTIATRTASYDDAPLAEAFRTRNVPERVVLNDIFFGGRLTL